MREEPGNVEPLVVVDPTLHGTDRDDFRARFNVEQAREVTSHIAKALDDDASALERNAKVTRVLLHDVHDAAARRLFASERSAERDRLARHDCRGVALAARVFVENPGHHLRVGVDVGGGDVAVGPEHDGDALREPARQSFELELGQLLRIDGDAALGAPERNVHERGLPGHDRRETQDLVVIGFRVIADPALAAALAGPARAVVLDAIAGEHLDPSVVHAHRHLDLHLAEWRHQDLPHVAFEVDQVGGALELVLDDRPAGHRRTTGAQGRFGFSHWRWDFTGSSTPLGCDKRYEITWDGGGGPPGGHRGFALRSMPGRDSARAPGACPPPRPSTRRSRR